MKNLNYIIHSVLGAAVVVLFILHFTGGEEAAQKTPTTTADSPRAASELTIAYFNVDSVMASWELYVNTQNELASKQSKMSNEFQKELNDLQKRQSDLQYKYNKQLILQIDAEKESQKLAADQQNLQTKYTNSAQQLQQEALVRNNQLIDKLEKFLKKYNEDKGYSFIFSYTFGGNLMYGDKAYDITSDVISGINVEYPVAQSK
jgi:outer membrane protein